jgi:rRNA maturation endonuclease Nob1
MVDEIAVGEAVPVPRCTWCSAPLPSESEATCPSCGATLIEETEKQVPGVTAIDAEAIIRGKADRPKSRSRLMSWISGEYEDEEKPAPPGSLAPPPLDVRREMLRLELAAQVANLQAEAGAMAAEAAIESGEPVDLSAIEPVAPEGTAEVAEPAADDETPRGAEPAG